MTTDETTREKLLERKIFELLEDDPLVKEHAKRLEVVVLREGDEGGPTVLMYFQVENGILDTVSSKIELGESWHECEISELAERFADFGRRAVENVLEMGEP